MAPLKKDLPKQSLLHAYSIHCTHCYAVTKTRKQPIRSQVKWHTKVPTAKLFVYRKQRAYRRKCDSAVSSLENLYTHALPGCHPFRFNRLFVSLELSRVVAVTEVCCSTGPPFWKVLTQVSVVDVCLAGLGNFSSPLIVVSESFA